MGVDVIVEEDRWHGVDFSALANQAVFGALIHLDVDPASWNITILAANDAKIAQLNLEFRSKNQPTNVLSWPSAERSASNPGEIPPRPTGDPDLGDIALGFETCAREANEAEMPLEDHVLHLIVHGLLHLLGYDHQHDFDADLMEATEIAILAKLGVPNPYVRSDAAGKIDDGKD